MALRSSTLQKMDAAISAVNTIQLRSQGRSINQITGELSLLSSHTEQQSRALVHISSQLEGIGQMCILTLSGLSHIDRRLTAIAEHFIATEERARQWSQMIAVMIDLEETVGSIGNEYDQYPVFATFCLEVVEHLAQKNGLEKENFHDLGHQRAVHEFRKKLQENRLEFDSGLREMKLITALRDFKSNLGRYHSMSSNIESTNAEISRLKKVRKQVSGRTSRPPNPKWIDELNEELESLSDQLDNLEEDGKEYDKLEKKMTERSKRLSEKDLSANSEKKRLETKLQKTKGKWTRHNFSSFVNLFYWLFFSLLATFGFIVALGGAIYDNPDLATWDGAFFFALLTIICWNIPRLGRRLGISGSLFIAEKKHIFLHHRTRNREWALEGEIEVLQRDIDLSRRLREDELASMKDETGITDHRTNVKNIEGARRTKAVTLATMKKKHDGWGTGTRLIEDQEATLAELQRGFETLNESLAPFLPVGALDEGLPNI